MGHGTQFISAPCKEIKKILDIQIEELYMKKLKNVDIIVVPFIITLIIMLVAGLANAIRPNIEQRLDTAPENIDRASFMLECTIDYAIDIEDCKRILSGGDPPILERRTGC